MQTKYDFLIIGGGVFGLSAAIELRKRRFKVALLNPDTLPHHLAASTDISKIVRMEYGSDQLYMDMAGESIKGWRNWNELLKQKLYHEIGFLMLMKQPINHPRQAFEYQSMLGLQSRSYSTELLDASTISERYPAVNSEYYPYAHFNPVAGYVEAAEVIRTWAAYARSIGVEIMEGQTAHKLKVEKGRLLSVITQSDDRFQAGHTIISAGAFTPILLPELQSQMKITGHPVFHLLPKQKTVFTSDHLPVFTADISNSGWYGFPVHPKEGVVKMARHTNGLAIHPAQDDRYIRDEEVLDLRTFLRQGFPLAQTDPLVFTRRCLYTDTLDGHFWIDQHPEIKGLSVASGGSGHGMKMGPVLGPLIADMAVGIDHPWLERFRWRNLSKDTLQKEEARFVVGGKLNLQ